MSIKSILVAVRGDGYGEGIMNHALKVASKFGSHIDVIHACPRPAEMLPFGVVMTSGMKETIINSAKTQADAEHVRVQELFNKYITDHGLTVTDHGAEPKDDVTVSWRALEGKQADLVAKHGVLADLVVVAQPDAELGMNTLEESLMTAGALTLMCPVKTTPACDNIAIAWNGGAEASRVVRSSMSILKKASTVTLLTSLIDRDDEKLCAHDMITYLAEHGVKAAVKELGPSVHGGDVLLHASTEVGADILVMGAYSHSRSREMVLGGATRHVMSHATIPVLMLH